MSDTHADTILTALRTRQRDLELDACAVRARVEEVAELIAILEGSNRRRVGRPRAAAALNPYPSQIMEQSLNTPVHMPGRVEGGVNQPEPQDAA